MSELQNRLISWAADVGFVRLPLKWLFQALIHLGVSWPMVLLYRRIIEETKSPGNPQITILALTSDRFRKDLMLLSETGRFRVLTLRFKWLGIMYSQFYPSGVERRTVFRPHEDERFERGQQQYRNFLRNFLPKLFKALRVDCVVNACIDYPQDYDWAAISHETGTPSVTLHKENLVVSRALQKRFVEWSSSLGKFHGTHLIVHNSMVRQAFCASGYVAPEHVEALGCMRMDDYIGSIENHIPDRDAPPLVTFFSFAPGVGLGLLFGGPQPFPTSREFGFFDTFDMCHTVVAELACENPEVRFVIKPKWGGTWETRIVETLSSAGFNLVDLPNLTIEPEADSQKLILQSAVVCGYGSTVLLEAAIANKRIVIPFTEEMKSPVYEGNIMLEDEFDLFDIAEDRVALKRLFLECLKNPSVSDEVRLQRRAVFEKYVSSITSSATDAYCDRIEHLVQESRS